MIPFAEVSMGVGACVECTRCSGTPADVSYRTAEAVVADATEALESWTGGAGPNVRLTGAEPFGHPELPRIVSGIMDAGCSRLAVDTDGIALRSETNARGALLAGVHHVRFDLLAGTEGVHDALAGTPGMLGATLAGIAAYRSVAVAEGLPVSVTARVRVCRHNAHDLPSAVATAVGCGADRVEVLIADGGLDIAGSSPWITAACDTGVVNGVWVEVEGLAFCLLPGYDLHLADAVRAREGSKPPVCTTCPLDAVCGGAPAGASGDQLVAVSPPPFAAVLAPRVARSRAVTGVR